jgi:hypothetical protein
MRASHPSIVLLSGAIALTGCGRTPVPATDHETQVAQHFVRETQSGSSVQQGWLNLPLKGSSTEAGYVAGKVASIANERCGVGVLLNYRGPEGHSKRESNCDRVWSNGEVFKAVSEHNGYFDGTIFDVARVRGVTPEQFRREWLAQSVSEVATIVWFEYKATKVGQYTNGFSAFRHSVDVSIIDLPRRLIVAQKTFTGPEPPEVIGKGVSTFNHLASREEIAQWLAGVPWKRGLLRAESAQ